MFLVKLSFFLFLTFCLSGCGTFRKMAIGSTSGLFYEASKELETDGNWENIKIGVMGNIKLMEGLLYHSPEDDDLLAGLTKAYAAYGFAVNETLYLEDKLAENDSVHNLNQALYNYSKAVEYGIRYLDENGLSWERIKKNISTAKQEFKDELGSGDRDLETVFYMGQALASLINLQKTDMTLISQVPLVKGMFDYVCETKPDFNNGACGIFYASYEAGRPKMLGGNPAKGKKIFIETIEKNPHNWFARAAYLEHYIIPTLDTNAYKKQKKFFLAAQKKLHRNNKWKPFRKKREDDFKERSLRIFQALAVKRFEIVKKYEGEIF